MQFPPFLAFYCSFMYSAAVVGEPGASGTQLPAPPPDDGTTHATWVRSASGRAAEGLRRQAVFLGRARHPGVEELREILDDGDTVRLVTTYVPGRHPSEVVASVEEAAGLSAVLATTLADLHEIGLSHGAVCDAAVIVDDTGQPVLVDFAAATQLEGQPRRWPTSPQAGLDVVGLADLLLGLVDRVAPLAERGRGRRRHAGQRDSGAALRRLCERARSGRAGTAGLTARAMASGTAAVPGVTLPQHQRPPAERTDSSPSEPAATAAPTTPTLALATAIREIEPNQAAPGHPRDWPSEHRPWGSGQIVRVRWLVVRSAVLLFVGGTVAWGLFGWAGFGRPTVVAHARRAELPGRSGPASEVPAATPAPTGAGDIASLAGGVLTVGHDRYSVGDAGDIVLLGRWTCGAASVAVVRPRDDTVWVFRGWPSPRLPAQAVLAGRVAGAIGARPRPAARCDSVEVERTDGSAVIIRPWRTIQ
jgi:hypothetical protein